MTTPDHRPPFVRAVDAAVDLLAEHNIGAEDARTLYEGALRALASEDPAKRAAASDLGLAFIGPDEYVDLVDILRGLESAAQRYSSDSARYFQSVYALFGSDGMRLAGLNADALADRVPSRIGLDRMLVFPSADTTGINIRFEMHTGAGQREALGAFVLPPERIPLSGDHVRLPRGEFVVRERVWGFEMFGPTPRECVIVVAQAARRSRL